MAAAAVAGCPTRLRRLVSDDGGLFSGDACGRGKPAIERAEPRSDVMQAGRGGASDGGGKETLCARFAKGEDDTRREERERRERVAHAVIDIEPSAGGEARHRDSEWLARGDGKPDRREANLCIEVERELANTGLCGCIGERARVDVAVSLVRRPRSQRASPARTRGRCVVYLN